MFNKDTALSKIGKLSPLESTSYGYPEALQTLYYGHLRHALSKLTIRIFLYKWWSFGAYKIYNKNKKSTMF